MAATLFRKFGPARIALILVSLWAFVLALTMMKAGAGSLAPRLEEIFDLSGILHSLGFGWFAAIMVLSGSPIAAASLTFFDADAIHEISALAMIVGSRVGAAFIVLGIGLIYVIRGRDRTRSLGIGLLALVVTVSTCLPALPVGALLLKSGALGWATLPSGGVPYKIVNSLFEPIAEAAVEAVAPMGAFAVGLGLIILSLSLFDRALPDMDDAEDERKWLRRNLYRPWIMFVAGAGLTIISLSVTISLSILIPLTQHRIVQQKYLVPYIMGANITTLVDTLFAAAVMDNPEAVPIVFAGLASIALLTLVILAVFYHRYESLMLTVTEWATANRRNLGISMGAFVVVPLVLLLT